MIVKHGVKLLNKKVSGLLRSTRFRLFVFKIIRRGLKMEVRWPISMRYLEILGVLKIHETYSESTILKIKESKDSNFKYDRKFLVEEARRICSLDDSLVDTRSGVVFPMTAPFQGRFSVERQNAIDPFHLSDTVFLRIPKKIMEGNWVCLPNRTLSHFLFDDLDRFVILIEHIHKHNLEYKLVIHPQSENYVLEIAKQLNVRRGIEYLMTPHFRAQRVFYTSVPNTEIYPSIDQISRIRGFFDEFFPAQKVRRVSKCKRIFVSRRGFHRQIPEELEISKFLESRGFLTVATQDLTWPQRREIFSNAESIIGVHGAGLSGILFCKPGTRVMELFPESMAANNFFHHLTSNLNLKFSRIEAKNFEHVKLELKGKFNEFIKN